MKFLQKLGKALMLPVACLPICGILMGIGYALCPATMQGGDITGIGNQIGFFLVKAGGALIDNMALLFVIGVGVGMAEKHDGTGGLAALASWLMITNLLSTAVVTTIMPSIAKNADATLAFDKISNPFIGILAGVIGSMCYNKFKDTKLPDWLSFFSGKRCVAIIAGVVSIIVSVVLLFVWPVVFTALITVGQSIAKMGAVGAGIYAFLNRLLIPTGLHHALNNVFWFDTIGLGDLTHFWAGETSKNVSWSLGMYMSGFFPCMMFGIPGAALAMIQTAKSNKKKIAIGLVGSAALCAFVCGVTEPFEFGFMFLAPGLYVIYAILYGIFTTITTLVGFRAGAALAMIQTAKSNKKKIAIGLVGSAALCAFVCGVTEPFEFGFMFLAPGLYVIYAILYGIFTTITTLVGFRAGFSFSAGATDLVFSSSLPAAQKTWMIIPLGIAAFIVFYVVFRIAITKFDLKTPGREDDDLDEENITLANDDFTAMAAVILEGLGGSANVKSIDNCITRLRLEINDDNKIDEAKIKSSGAAGIIRPGKGNIQVIIGPKVQFVADEMEKLCK